MLIKYVALLLKRKKAKQPFNQLLYLFTVSYKLSERQCDSQNLQFRIPYTPAPNLLTYTPTHTQLRSYFSTFRITNHPQRVLVVTWVLFIFLDRKRATYVDVRLNKEYLKNMQYNPFTKPYLI